MPATESELFQCFKSLGIETETKRHEAMFTVKDAKRLRGEMPGGHCKSLFLKDKKGRLWLVVMLEDKPLDMKTLQTKLGSARLSFGNPELMQDVLGVAPGSVTPFCVLNQSAENVQVVLDSELTEFPEGRAIWFLGDIIPKEEHKAVLLAIAEKGVSENFSLDYGRWNLPIHQRSGEGTPLLQADHSGIQVARHPDDEDLTIGWVRCYRDVAIPGLARKLPHYGKYSYLLFEGDEPTNVAKGEWSTGSSPLSWTAEGVNVGEIEEERFFEKN